MPNITDKTEIEITTDEGENVKFGSELELIKHIHGFMPRTPKNAHLPKEEIDARWLAKHKNIKNNAR